MAPCSFDPPDFPLLSLTGEDHALGGTCQFHFGVMVGLDGCPACSQPVRAIPMPAQRPQITSNGPGGPLVIKASGIESNIFFLHGGVTAPTRIEEGDRANDHREMK